MLIDSNVLFFENAALTGAITGTACPLTSLKQPGMAEPIPIFISVSETAVGGTSITLTLQHSDDSTSANFSTVAETTIPIADLKAGAKIAWRFLPQTVMKKWVRVNIAETGTFTAGKVTGFIAREDYEPYRDGLYIDKGKSYPEAIVPYVSMACGTKNVTSGTATALGSTACVLESNDSTGTYSMSFTASGSATLSTSTLTAQTVANLNTAIQTITVTTTANCTILATVFDSYNNPMSNGIIYITV